MAAVRVLHMVSGDLWAGAEARVAAFVAELARDPQPQLHAVVLNPGELERRLRAAGVGVTILDESRLSAWGILRGIRAVVRDFRPDVIHTHREKENVLGGLAVRLAAAPRCVRCMVRPSIGRRRGVSTGRRSAGSIATPSATGSRPRWRCPTSSVCDSGRNDPELRSR